jgi:hypothetical protein
LAEYAELIVLTGSHAFAPFLYRTKTNERFMPTRAAAAPSPSSALGAPAALLSLEDSTLPAVRRLGCLELVENAVPAVQDARTLQ